MSVFARAANEIKYLRGALPALRRASAVARDPTRTWPVVAAELAARHGDKPAVVGVGESLSYRELDARANAYARVMLRLGIGRGDCVALLMPNRPEYLAVWLGIARAGGVTALLNTNLRGAALAHCAAIVRPRFAVVDAEMAALWRTALPHLADAPRLLVHGEAEGERLDLLVATVGDAPLAPGEAPLLTHEDRCLYIYTSGTTGLPKAANVNHYRVVAAMTAFSAATGATADDRLYVCLPLYHTSGGVLAVGTALIAGGTVVVAPRFSASRFWDDVVDRGCTMVQYIGELCRYLVNAPPHPKERAHRLRLATGNGLRPDVWEAFRTRFAIPRILEWYAATEGNLVLFNFDGTVGAVGRVPFWARFRFPLAILKLDPTTGEPVRGGDGRCVRAAAGEPGELVSKIVVDPKLPSQRFEGYAVAEDGAGRLLRDVVVPGDLWFRSGDLMRRDRRGYYEFLDRLGDTFRWKGENVATSEVDAVLGGIDGVKGAAVYGVAVPGHEGKAGMVALAAEGLDLARMAGEVDARLPAYARPVFLRLLPDLPATGTFKLIKQALVREGYDPRAVADPLFVRLDGGGYEPLTPAVHARIAAGVARL